jgi:hypothetical protein
MEVTAPFFLYSFPLLSSSTPLPSGGSFIFYDGMERPRLASVTNFERATLSSFMCALFRVKAEIREVVTAVAVALSSLSLACCSIERALLSLSPLNWRGTA